MEIISERESLVCCFLLLLLLLAQLKVPSISGSSSVISSNGVVLTCLVQLVCLQSDTQSLSPRQAGLAEPEPEPEPR